MPTRNLSLQNNLDMKCMQVNVLKKAARVTKRGSDIQTDQIGRQILYYGLWYYVCEVVMVSNTYHYIFVNVSLSNFNTGLKDLLIL